MRQISLESFRNLTLNFDSFNSKLYFHSKVTAFLQHHKKTIYWFLCLCMSHCSVFPLAKKFLKMNLFSIFRVYLKLRKIIQLVNIVKVNRKKYPTVCSVISPMTSLCFLVGKSGCLCCSGTKSAALGPKEIYTKSDYYLTASLQQKPKQSKKGFTNLLMKSRIMSSLHSTFPKRFFTQIEDYKNDKHNLELLIILCASVFIDLLCYYL